MTTALVSVIIPAYNAEKYLSEALDSVFAQNYAPIEVIVVDDGSTDSTASIAQSYPEVHYVYEANLGHAAAKNTGLKHCTGTLVSFLDADDYWPSDKLLIQVTHLEQRLELGCVIGRMRNFLEKGMIRPHWISQSMLAEESVALSLGAVLARRWVFDQIGYFDLRYPHGNDLDWFIRLTEAKIPMEIMHTVFLHRRIHGSNLSADQKTICRARIRILKAAMDRKRRARPDRMAEVNL